MRPLPIGLARQRAVVPIALNPENIASPIIQDRDGLRPIAIAGIAPQIHAESYILEIAVLHVEQDGILSVDKHTV